ncbi:MAG: NAD-dependent epimerase/dehydratase family protein [Gammaproteobacteria bacterium]
MTKRNILLLGGTGYFGRHLVNKLLENGDKVCIVTRGINQVSSDCLHINFDRSKGNHLLLDGYWDVVYDQSCYSSEYLNGLNRVIGNCGQYILTSSQSVYPPGKEMSEDSINYNDVNSYKNIINNYGFEKLKSEYIIRSLTQSHVFPRFPVVVGENDPRKRIQCLAQKVTMGSLYLPAANPLLHMLDEHDAATVLFEIPFKHVIGPVNIASNEIISAYDLCKKIADIKNLDLTIHESANFESSPFDLIKSESKTLLLKKQNELGFHDLKSIQEILETILKPVK